MSEMMVSVCMITYNHEPFIREAIEGVLMQKTNFPIELVIGEDCSTDRTREICLEYKEKYPDKIRLLLNENNLGMMPNFIKTLKACTGKYIALCEGDDYWTDKLKLQKQVEFLEDNVEYVICAHDVEVLKNGEKVNDFITREVNETTRFHDLVIGNFLHTPSIVFRNILEISELPNFHKVGLGDYYLLLYLAQFGLIKKLKDKMSVYRFGVGLWSGEKDEHERREKRLSTFKYASFDFNKNIEIAEKWFDILIYSGKNIRNFKFSKDFDHFENKLTYLFDVDNIVENVSIKTLIKAILLKIVKFFFTRKNRQ